MLSWKTVSSSTVEMDKKRLRNWGQQRELWTTEEKKSTLRNHRDSMKEHLFLLQGRESCPIYLAFILPGNYIRIFGRSFFKIKMVSGPDFCSHICMGYLNIMQIFTCE